MNTTHLPAFTHKELHEFLLDVGMHTSVLIWGPPGSGKSELGEAFADALGLRFVQVITSMLNPEDLQVPVVDPDTRQTYFCPPARLFRDERGNPTPLVLMLDEVSAAEDSNLRAIYPLINERRLGDQRLPDGSVVLLIANPVTTTSVARPLPATIMDRCYHVTIVLKDTDSWLEHARAQHLHPWVITYVEDGGLRHLEQRNLGDDEISTTLRGWTRLGRILTAPYWQLDRLTEDLKEQRLSPGNFQQRLKTIACGSIHHIEAEKFASNVTSRLIGASLSQILRGEAELPSDFAVLSNLMMELNRRLSRELPPTQQLSSAQHQLADRATALLTRLQSTPDLVQAALAGNVPAWFTNRVTSRSGLN